MAEPGIAQLRPVQEDRSALVRQALVLEYFTIGWNLVEGVVAIGAALAAGSIALLAFGVESFVEATSASILVWRLRAEQALKGACPARIDRRALRLVGLSLFGLAVYVAVEASWALLSREQPSATILGIVITILSIGVMLWLARAKRRLAVGLGSKALEADAFQTTACWWLSLIALGGIGLNALFGWWWADPSAALVMAGLLVREGRKAWRGEECCA